MPEDPSPEILAAAALLGLVRLPEHLQNPQYSRADQRWLKENGLTEGQYVNGERYGLDAALYRRRDISESL